MEQLEKSSTEMLGFFYLKLKIENFSIFETT